MARSRHWVRPLPFQGARIVQRLAGHAVAGEIQAHDEVGTSPADRLSMSGDLRIIGHSSSMNDKELARQLTRTTMYYRDWQ